MSTVRLEVERRAEVGDGRRERTTAALRAAGFGGAEVVGVRDVYVLHGTPWDGEVAQLVTELLADPVAETVRAATPAGPLTVDIAYRPGVTDSVAETVIMAAALLGVGLERVATGTRWEVAGHITPEALKHFAREHLANAIVQRIAVGALIPSALEAAAAPAPVERIPLYHADDARLLAVSSERRLSLDTAEMRAIQAHFRELRREPTDVELEMLAQTWSEHCVHKTFRAHIDYIERRADGTVDEDASGVVDGLLKTTIRAATETLARPWVRSAFVDNAGIVAFDDAFDVAIKVETHNRPSALEPFGGAATGVGGVIRDIMGVSARPIAALDVLCFGPEDTDAAALPAGVLHPARVRAGVLRGIEDYGNKMGVPTVAGAILHDPGYLRNPLVFVGAVGVLPRGSHPTAPEVGDLVVVVGGRTGRDGLRGATFSSMGMDRGTAEVSGGAVQIGHPIAEKQALEVLLAARDEGLYHAVTDCGAGGLSSAVGEMGRELGVEVELARVPRKYAGLAPWEVWLSEAQERMVFAVPPSALGRMQAIAAVHRIGCDAIGHFTGDGRVRVLAEGAVVAELDAGFLHEGLPRRRLRAEWQAPGPAAERAWPATGELGAALRARLADPNVRSREEVIRRFDHEVQGGTVVRPLVGVDGAGHADGAVLVPFEARAGTVGVALGVGLPPTEVGRRDPYALAWVAVDEAVRNVVAVGADPDRVAILDNFSWGDCARPDRLGALVRSCRGAHDAALAYGTPFVSGKDSLNNEWTDEDGESHAIPPTLVVTALGRVPDVTRTVTSDLKAPGSALYVVGETRDEATPRCPADAPETFRALHGAMRRGLVRACHDCSEGGILVALAEMAIGGGMGADLALDAIAAPAGTPAGARALAEWPSRFLVEVAPADAAAFEAAMGAAVVARVGETTPAPVISWRARDGSGTLELAEARAAWRGPVPPGASPGRS